MGPEALHLLHVADLLNQGWGRLLPSKKGGVQRGPVPFPCCGFLLCLSAHDAEGCALPSPSSQARKEVGDRGLMKHAFWKIQVFPESPGRRCSLLSNSS
jgi:hypothetical protein